MLDFIHFNHKYHHEVQNFEHISMFLIIDASSNLQMLPASVLHNLLLNFDTCISHLGHNKYKHIMYIDAYAWVKHKLKAKRKAKTYLISSPLKPQYRRKFNCLVICQQTLLCCR